MFRLNSISRVNRRSAASDRLSKLDVQNTPVLINKLAFFYLKIGNFRSFFVSDLIVITVKPAPVVLPHKSEALGKGLISYSIGQRGVS